VATSAVVRQLLDLPAPAPDWRKALHWANGQVPADDTPIDALGHYRAKQAGAALRKVFEEGHTDRSGRSIVAAMLACDALSEKEIAEAVEAYCRDNLASAGRPQAGLFDEDRRPVKVELGEYLSRLAADREGACELLLARVRALGASDPNVADALVAVVSKWTAPAVDRYLVGRLKVAAEWPPVCAALNRHDQMRKNVPVELRAMSQAGGARAGVAAAVLGDPNACRRLLQGPDTPAQKLLLACARLLRTELPVALVGRLMKEADPLLSQAAERYLVSEDSVQARKLVLARHPGEMRILGARMGFDPGHSTYGAFDDTEQRLGKELPRPGGPDQIISLLSEGYWGNDGQRIIRIKGDQASLSVERYCGKSLSRPLTESQRKGLLEMISMLRFDDLPPLITPVYDGMQYEYVRLTRDGGRRVFMNNPGTAGTAGKYAIRAAHDYDAGAREVGGLWRCRKGKQPERICDKTFARPVVTPDGKWAVAPRDDEGWAQKRPIIRVNLATGKQLPIDVGPARDAEAVCYLPSHGKMLISLTVGERSLDGNDPVIQAEKEIAAEIGAAVAAGGGDLTEYRLLDPATGKTEIVHGQFAPLEQLTYRPLQPNRNADETWAAIPDADGAGTRIGRYDLKRFAFHCLLSLPKAQFTSMQMWVDETEPAAYVVMNGDLLRIPLPTERAVSRPAL
jgi:hypothetical protein